MAPHEAIVESKNFLRGIFRNFRPFTRAADYPHWSIFVRTRRKFQQSTSTGRYPAPKNKRKSSTHTNFPNFFVVDMISFYVQLINLHTFCLRCFIENDTTYKNMFSKKIYISKSTSRRNCLKGENTL